MIDSHAAPRARHHRCFVWLMRIVCLGTLGYCASMPFGVVVPHRHAPESFRNYRHLPDPDLRFLLASLLAVPCAVGLARAARKRRRPHAAWGVAGIVLLAGTVQLCVGFVARQRFEGMTERMTRASHAPLTEDAYKVATPGLAMRNFQRLARTPQEQGGLSWQAKTKPPGLLACYVAIRRASERPDVRRLTRTVSGNGLFAVRWSGLTSDQADRKYFLTFAGMVFSVLAALAVLPLYFLAGQCLGRRWALPACGLYMLAPNVVLVVMHTDQNLVVLATLAPVALAGAAFQHQFQFQFQRGRSVAWLAAAGVLAGCALQVAYAALFAVAIIELLILLQAMALRPVRRGAGFFVSRAGAFNGACVAAVLLCQWLGGYDSLACYRLAMDEHSRIYYWLTLRTYAWVSLSEFAQWTGIPIVVLGLAWVSGSVARVFNGRAAFGHVLALAFVTCWWLLVLSGRTRAETARLWIFLVPYLALFAACGLKRYGGRAAGRYFVIAAALELATTLATKLWMDFS